MNETKRDIKELRRLQSLNLNQKIDHAIGTVEKFCNEIENPVISFSGGKDSTVLLHIIRNIMKTDIPAIFVNTGNEYPDIVRFVKEFDNVQIIQPKIRIREIIEKYGFPLISKEYSKMIYALRRGDKHSSRYLSGINPSNNSLTSFILPPKYHFLINEKFSCSHKCCNFLKKQPTAKYDSITGDMASESIIRQSAWLMKGCNSFGKRSKSKPLSIWTDKNVFEYINRFQVRICDIYKDQRVMRTGCMFCGFGAHLESISRFELVKEKYPAAYKYFLRLENSGVTYEEALNRCGIILPHQLNYQTNIFAEK
jgi:3'-phosphoadenosine 5'-phosphosulfate sulfotransferase (PAPS reductase)/FAD synthetase